MPVQQMAQQVHPGCLLGPHLGQQVGTGCARIKGGLPDPSAGQQGAGLAKAGHFVWNVSICVYEGCWSVVAPLGCLSLGRGQGGRRPS